MSSFGRFRKGKKAKKRSGRSPWQRKLAGRYDHHLARIERERQGLIKSVQCAASVAMSRLQAAIIAATPIPKSDPETMRAMRTEKAFKIAQVAIDAANTLAKILSNP